MRRDDSVYLGHMLDTARKIAERAARLDRAAYDADEDARMVLTHLLQIVGEAAGRVSRPFREMHPEIPWQGIVGIRHRLVHDYMTVDYDIVWAVAMRDIPSLVAVLTPLVPGEGERP